MFFVWSFCTIVYSVLLTVQENSLIKKLPRRTNFFDALKINGCIFTVLTYGMGAWGNAFYFVHYCNRVKYTVEPRTWRRDYKAKYTWPKHPIVCVVGAYQLTRTILCVTTPQTDNIHSFEFSRRRICQKHWINLRVELVIKIKLNHAQILLVFASVVYNNNSSIKYIHLKGHLFWKIRQWSLQ